jgi:hypothetical protein
MPAIEYDFVKVSANQMSSVQQKYGPHFLSDRGLPATAMDA